MAKTIKRIYLDYLNKCADIILQNSNLIEPASEFGNINKQFSLGGNKNFNIFRQSVCLGFSILYTYDDENNHFFNNQNLINFIQANINIFYKYIYKIKLDIFQNNTYCLAYTCLAISRTFFIIKNSDKKFKKKIIDTIKKIAFFISNANSPAAEDIKTTALETALFSNLFLLTKNKEFLNYAKKKFILIKKNQSSEGFFLQNHDFDLSSMLEIILYLSIYHKNTNDDDVIEVIKKLSDFLIYIICPDGRIDYNIYSGSDKNCYISGLEYFSDIKNIASLKDLFLTNFSENHLISYPFNNIIKNFNDIAICLINNKQSDINLCLPFKQEENFEIFYKYAGFFIKKINNYYLIINLYKSGCFVLFDIHKKCLIKQMGGYILKSKNTEFTSYYYNLNTKILNKEKEINITTEFIENKFLPISKFDRLINFLAQICLFVHPKIFFLLKNLFIKNKNKPNPINISLKRKFKFNDDKIVLTDFINKKDKIRIIKICRSIYNFEKCKNNAAEFIKNKNTYYASEILNNTNFIKIEETLKI